MEVTFIIKKVAKRYDTKSTATGNPYKYRLKLFPSFYFLRFFLS